MQTHHLRFYQAACNGAHTPPVRSSPAAHHSIHLLALLSACHYKIVIFHPVIAICVTFNPVFSLSSRFAQPFTTSSSGGGVDAAGGRGGESHCGCHLDCFTPTVFAMTEVVLQGAAVTLLGCFTPTVFTMTECVAFATMGKAVIAVTKQAGSTRYLLFSEWCLSAKFQTNVLFPDVCQSNSKQPSIFPSVLRLACQGSIFSFPIISLNLSPGGPFTALNGG